MRNIITEISGLVEKRTGLTIKSSVKCLKYVSDLYGEWSFKSLIRKHIGWYPRNTFQKQQ